MELSDAITTLVRQLPQADRFVLEVQMRRAALSIAANIAEGQQRHHLGDFLRHLSFARGSNGELRTYLLAVRRLAVDLAEVSKAEALSDSVGRMLTSLSARLRVRWTRPGVHQP